MSIILAEILFAFAVIDSPGQDGAVLTLVLTLSIVRMDLT